MEERARSRAFLDLHDNYCSRPDPKRKSYPSPGVWPPLRSSISDSALQSAINGCVKADRLLAEIAITEATPNGRASDIDEARRELARGDSEAAAGKFEQAIERYSHAWKKAIEARGH